MSMVPGATPPSDPLLFTIGDIGVSRHWVVTPNGSAPLSGSQWIGQDHSREQTGIPAWAIVLAIIFFLACLLGLLFLLAKETKVTGYFEVTVRSGQVMHTTQLPVSNAQQVAQYRAMVHHAQAMAAGAA